MPQTASCAPGLNERRTECVVTDSYPCHLTDAWTAGRWIKLFTGTHKLGWCLCDDDGNVAWISQEIAEKLMKNEEN